MSTTGNKIQSSQEIDKNGKQRPKPISEKRRLQNRQAQRTFREKTKKQKQLLRQLKNTQSSLVISTLNGFTPSPTYPAEKTKTALSPISASCTVQRDGCLNVCQFPADIIYQRPNYSSNELYHGLIPEDLPSPAQDQFVMPVTLQDIHQSEKSSRTPRHETAELYSLDGNQSKNVIA
ncbi:hypothetical protein M432DRAFT_432574 [Thermoascus aurantiacus ATCC 26904]